MIAFRKKHMPGLAVLAGSTILAIAAPCARAGQWPSPFFTKPVTATAAPDLRGFLRRWLLLEPVRIQIRSNWDLTDSFVQAAIKKEYFPGQFTAVPRAGDKVTVGEAELTWHAVDSTAYSVNLYHFARDVEKPPFNVAYWAVTVVDCPREMPNVRLAVGSNSASIWWVNGKEVFDIYGDRHLIIDDGVSKRLTLNKGPNVVRGAVVNAPGLSNMCARFLDANDKPVKDLTVRLSEAGK
jgi:hypothetical protein